MAKANNRKFALADTDNTSDETMGQVHVPFINWFLLLGTVGLVLGFFLFSNAGSPTDFFRLPPDRVVEIGAKTEI